MRWCADAPTTEHLDERECLWWKREVSPDGMLCREHNQDEFEMNEMLENMRVGAVAEVKEEVGLQSQMKRCTLEDCEVLEGKEENKMNKMNEMTETTETEMEIEVEMEG